MGIKKFIDNSKWTLIFHTMTSLFYLRMFFIFMSTKNVIFAGRMLTTWYLAFHIGFIILRLVQDVINIIPRKNSKFNEIFIKFNNLIFISLIFPFALYIPLIYWLIFCYDSNLMLPNFVEISLPTWVSISSHTVIASVALVEMTTTKYSYEGNHFSSVIIMSIFSAGYFACLIGTYVQYGFWLYPVFHLIPLNYLPLVFSTLMALLLFMYFVGKIIVQRFHDTALEGTDSTNEKIVKDDIKEILPNLSENILEVQNNDVLDEKSTKDDVEKILPISNEETSVVQNNDSQIDFQNKDEKYVGSPLIILKNVLEKVILIPFRSNIQKTFLDENHNPSLKHLNRISNGEISDLNLNEYVKVDEGDGMNSSSYLTVKKECRIPLRDVSKRIKHGDQFASEEGEHATRRDDGKYHYSIQAIDGDHALNISLVSNKNNPNVLKGISKNPLDECDNSQLKIKGRNAKSTLNNASATDDIEEPSLSVSSGSGYDFFETGDEVGSSRKNHGNDEESLINSLPTHKAVSNDYVPHHELKSEEKLEKKQDKTFSFRLELFPNESEKSLLQTEGRKEKQNFIVENPSQKTNSENEKSIELDTVKERKIKAPKTGKTANYSGSRSRKSKRKGFPNSAAYQPTSSKPTAIHKHEKTFQNNDLADTTDKKCESRDPSTNYADTNYSTIKTSNEKFNRHSPQNYAEIEVHRSPSNPEENYECSDEIPRVVSSTSKTKFLNPLLMNFYSKMETRAINSSLESKSDEKIEKKEKNKCSENMIKRCNLREKNLDQAIPEIDMKEKRTNESANEPKKTLEFKCVKCYECGESNRKKGKYGKFPFGRKKENKTNDEIEYIYNHKKDKQKCKTTKSQEGFEEMCINHFTFSREGICKCKKLMNIEENESTSGSLIFHKPKCKNHHAPRTCEQLWRKKSTDNIKNPEHEKPRYELLPKLNCCLRKINFVNYSSTLEKDRKKKNTVEKETWKNKSTSDQPVSQECPLDGSNQWGNNTKRKFSAKFFKFPTNNRKADRDGKEFEEISKKLGDGSKIEPILTTTSSKNEPQSNIDINDVEVLQNLHASLFPNDSKHTYHVHRAYLL